MAAAAILSQFERIAVEVYGGDAPKYQPSTDPIICVEAARLGSKLREYYEGIGAALVRGTSRPPH